jgi:hypothetical protein
MPVGLTMKATRPLSHWALGAVLLGASAACSVLGSPSKVRAGQLYVSGSGRYDTYFGEIHAEQVAAANWPEDRKTARKPLLDVLKLLPDADDGTIEQATKDRLTGMLRLEVQGTDVHVVETAASRQNNPHEVLAAVELAARSEIERAKKLSELPARVEALAKTGRELESHIAEDFAGAGQKPFEVRDEIRASYDVLVALSQGGAREKKEAEQFVAELGHAVSAGSEPPSAGVVPLGLTKPHPAKAPPSKPEPPVEPAPKPQPRTAPVAHMEPAPKPAPVSRAERPPAPKPAPPPPAPKPAAKSSEAEVFNP